MQSWVDLIRGTHGSVATRKATSEWTLMDHTDPLQSKLMTPTHTNGVMNSCIHHRIQYSQSLHLFLSRFAFSDCNVIVNSSYIPPCCATLMMSWTTDALLYLYWYHQPVMIYQLTKSTKGFPFSRLTYAIFLAIVVLYIAGSPNQL